MTVVIVGKENNKYPLTISDIKDGCAYESEDGYIVIGNRSRGQEIVAFSIKGDVIIYDYEHRKFRDITLKVEIE